MKQHPLPPLLRQSSGVESLAYVVQHVCGFSLFSLLRVKCLRSMDPLPAMFGVAVLAVALLFGHVNISRLLLLLTRTAAVISKRRESISLDIPPDARRTGIFDQQQGIARAALASLATLYRVGKGPELLTLSTPHPTPMQYVAAGHQQEHRGDWEQKI